MAATDPSPDHQPRAIPEGGRYRSGCLCAWTGPLFDLRAEALVMARALHEGALTC
jgi:hypothetical protein